MIGTEAIRSGHRKFTPLQKSASFEWWLSRISRSTPTQVIAHDLDSDLRNLIHQRLVARRDTSVLKKESQQVLTLTKEGKRLIRRHGFVLDDQAIYSGFVKPKEADHDAALYRLYHKAADEIERKGGKVLRVQLDYELKEKLYRKLGQAQGTRRASNARDKEALAHQLQLPVVHGKVSFPDLRIEYANAGNGNLSCRPRTRYRLTTTPAI